MTEAETGVVQLGSQAWRMRESTRSWEEVERSPLDPAEAPGAQQ